MWQPARCTCDIEALLRQVVNAADHLLMPYVLDGRVLAFQVVGAYGFVHHAGQHYTVAVVYIERLHGAPCIQQVCKLHFHHSIFSGDVA